jgi:hypothetical protein
MRPYGRLGRFHACGDIPIGADGLFQIFTNSSSNWLMKSITLKAISFKVCNCARRSVFHNVLPGEKIMVHPQLKLFL